MGSIFEFPLLKLAIQIFAKSKFWLPSMDESFKSEVRSKTSSNWFGGQLTRINTGIDVVYIFVKSYDPNHSFILLPKVDENTLRVKAATLLTKKYQTYGFD